jgi:hypothetical protein
MNEPKHGDVITWFRRMEKYFWSAPNKPYPRRVRQSWRPVSDSRVKFEAGVFLGWRSLQTGYTAYSEDYGAEFVQEGRVRAAYVSVDARTNPVYVDPTGIILTTPTPRETWEALDKLYDAFLSRHGCFPLDRFDEKRTLWNDAMCEASVVLGRLIDKDKGHDRTGVHTTEQQNPS